MRAFCSSANLGPGYDIVGLALNAFHDIVEVELVKGDGRAEVVDVRGPYSNSIPLGERNSAAEAARAALKLAEQRLDAKIRIWKGVPPRRGLGSSGASAAATVRAIDILLGGVLKDEELVKAASEGERISSGSAHPDNVAPSLFGGLVVIGREILKFKLDFEFLLAIPWIDVPENKTEYMRNLIPKEVPLDKFSKHCLHLSHLMLGIALNDARIFGEGMNYSFIDECRSRSIPRFDELRRKALENGALGVSISGAGPSILILCEDCPRVSRVLRDEFKRIGVPATILGASPAEGASAL